MVRRAIQLLLVSVAWTTHISGFSHVALTHHVSPRDGCGRARGRAAAAGAAGSNGEDPMEALSKAVGGGVGKHGRKMKRVKANKYAASSRVAGKLDPLEAQYVVRRTVRVGVRVWAGLLFG